MICSICFGTCDWSMKTMICSNTLGTFKVIRRQSFTNLTLYRNRRLFHNENQSFNGHVESCRSLKRTHLPRPCCAVSKLPESNTDEQESRRLKAQKRIQQRTTYQFAAIAASSLVVSLAIFATYYRISWHLNHGDEFPYEELASTLLLALGGMVGMEMYARWAHRFLWHENELGWTLHKSHHEPRTGAFEANDIYAVMNAVPAIFLCGYGFMRPDVVGGLCFGLGLGITLFGISYMFVHDGLVHRRFPVGPIADVPVLRRVAVAHQMHHSDKYGGVPFGMFLGPMELKEAGFEKDFEILLNATSPDQKKKPKKV